MSTQQNQLRNTSIGNTKIIDVKISDAKQLIIDLSQNGLKYSTIKTIKTLIKAAFKMAQEDDLILKNPFDFQLNEVIKNNTKKRVALTEQQYSNLIEFVLCDSSVQITLDVYTSIDADMIKTEFAKVAQM